MKLLVTGLNGTLAPVVADCARARGHTIVGWDRSRIDPGDVAAAQSWLASQVPAAIAHLALGGVEWSAWLARYAWDHALPFVFTSTAMVFHHEPDGPHRVDDRRNARDDYGLYKIQCEDAVLAAHAHATVLRLGWQIDPDRAGNNMLLALDAWQRRDGCVAASRAWRPACSFMADTAEAIVDLLERALPGVQHFDSNSRDAHSFFEIAEALRTQYARCDWVVQEHDEYRHDQRLVGGDLVAPPISRRLTALRRA
ncbi:MAG TPA: sugar nucleotide-binding protein [Steroidobacteraceae bacterium]|nr:sugar nucleotide-binding protein [Steroidobacteraceae bacterium]